MTFKPGDKVRVRADIDLNPWYQPGEVGTLLSIHIDDTFEIDFAGAPSQGIAGNTIWYATHDELEPAP